MQEKIWGGTHLRMSLATTFKRPCPESTGLFLLTPWIVSTIKNELRYAGQTLDILYAEHRELFGNRREPVFPLLTKILDANWLSVQSPSDDAYGLEHEGELGWRRRTKNEPRLAVP